MLNEKKTILRVLVYFIMLLYAVTCNKRLFFSDKKNVISENKKNVISENTSLLKKLKTIGNKNDSKISCFLGNINNGIYWNLLHLKSDLQS